MDNLIFHETKARHGIVWPFLLNKHHIKGGKTHGCDLSQCTAAYFFVRFTKALPHPDPYILQMIPGPDLLKIPEDHPGNPIGRMATVCKEHDLFMGHNPAGQPMVIAAMQTHKDKIIPGNSATGTGELHG